MGARVEREGPAVRDRSPAGPTPDALGGFEDGAPSRAGLLLARLTVAPALLLVSWLAVGLPALMAGSFTFGLTFALFVPVAAVVLTLGLRGVRPMRASWGTLIAVLAIVVAFLVFQLVMCGEQIMVRRDPASYFNFATWLTGHGSLPIPANDWAFGGGDRALDFGSPAFFQRGDDLIPQFMAGMPIIVAVGGWLGGPQAMLAVLPVVGALAVLSFAGLTARLVGPRWAPLGAFALAATLPMIVISRSIYSETGALVLTLGGLALVLDAVRTNRRIPALLGGLALGLTLLVRIDGIRDVLPVVAFAGLLVGLRRRSGLPLFLGLAAGAGAGLLEGYTMSGPYLHYLRESLNPALILAGGVVAATLVMAVLVRWRGLPDLSRFRLPDLAVLATVLVMAFFAARPAFQVVRRVPHNHDDRENAAYTAVMQRANKLPIDPNRLYSELSLHWVTWYIGVPAVLLATVGAALILRGLLRRRAAIWLLPYAVIVWTTVTTLYRPGITPDHPWASRRLIQIVLPGLLLFALWALARGVAWIRRRRPRLAAPAAIAGTLLILVPTVLTSAVPAALKIDQGEVAQTRGMCDAIGQRASVILVDKVVADRFSQTIRSMCGLPAGRVRVAPGAPSAPPADVDRVIGKVIGAGRRPVVLGQRPDQIQRYGPVKRVFHISTRQDGHTLTHAPTRDWALRMDVFMAQPEYAG